MMEEKGKLVVVVERRSRTAYMSVTCTFFTCDTDVFRRLGPGSLKLCCFKFNDDDRSRLDTMKYFSLLIAALAPMCALGASVMQINPAGTQEPVTKLSEGWDWKDCGAYLLVLCGVIVSHMTSSSSRRLL